MHFYQFNIGDYISHTRHLTLIEDLAYRRLLDLYYLHEQPLNECSTHVARLLNMRENVQEIETVLHEFFELEKGTGWINPRADEEIERFKAKRDAASKAGKASAERRFNDRSTPVQPNKKQETVNNSNGGKEKNAPRFTPPTPDEVREYCKERQNLLDAERFVDFYESKGWMVGKSKMKDWKAAVRNWERSQQQSEPAPRRRKYL